MILDSSAVCAIVLKEAEAAAFTRAAGEAEAVRMASPSFVEAAIVIDGKGQPELSRSLDDVLALLEVEIAPFTERQARIAREAFRDFGRGSGHPAGLNLGDCFAYALAKDAGEPLLYKGDDFAHTDVRSVFPRGHLEGVSDAQ